MYSPFKLVKGQPVIEYIAYSLFNLIKEQSVIEYIAYRLFRLIKERPDSGVIVYDLFRSAKYSCWQVRIPPYVNIICNIEWVKHIHPNLVTLMPLNNGSCLCFILYQKPFDELTIYSMACIQSQIMYIFSLKTILK